MLVTAICVAWALISGVLSLFFAWRVRRFFAEVRQLRDEPLPAEPFAWPRVSLIVPACDEAATIRPAVESLLRLDYPFLELVLIDDRSTDGTTAILRELAVTDSRVRLVEIRELPAGWLGKVHAIYRGAAAATGEWLLFTDADVIHRPQSLKKAVAACVRQDWDFLCVLPSIIARSLPLRALFAQLQTNIAVSANLQGLRDPATGDCMGGGAFNLVRRTAYARSPGHEWLRLEILDDFGLAYAVKLAGGRLGFLAGLEEIELEWYASFGAFVRGLEKNSFAGIQYSVVALALLVGGTLFFAGGIALAPLLAGSFSVAAFAWASVLAYVSVVGSRLPRVLRVSPWIAAYIPLTTLFMPFVIVRSAWICLRQGGVRWRGTFYPLAALREHQRLRILDVVLKRRHAPLDL